ncbi:MAG TPA: hypothetical protein VNR61_19330 [Niallia sp.]|nr:hypothetical protein [Niallia sp.]
MDKKRINKNSTPYLLLTVIHVLIYVAVLRKKAEKKTWAFLLANIGMAFLFEYLTLNIFHGYRYKPNIMKNKRFDSILGAIFSQAIYIPIISTYITIFKKDWTWKILFSYAYYKIEHLFLKKKIYKIYWWTPKYTFILLILYFYISEWFYKALGNRLTWVLKLTHYLSIEVILSTGMYINAVKRYIRVGRGFFHTWKEHFIIVPMYTLVLSFIAVYTSSRSGWLYWILPIGIQSILEAILIKYNIFKVNMTRTRMFVERIVFMVLVPRFLYRLIYVRGKIEE